MPRFETKTQLADEQLFSNALILQIRHFEVELNAAGFFNDVVLKHEDLVRWLEIQGAQAKMGKFHDLSFLQLFKHIKCIFPILACAPCNGLFIEKQEFELYIVKRKGK